MTKKYAILLASWHFFSLAGVKLPEPLAVMVLAVRAQDKDNPTYKKIAEIFHSDAVKKFIADKYNGTIEPAE